MTKETKELEWGETPWDNLSKEELLFQVRKMYSALNETYSTLRILQGNTGGEHSPYWSKQGSGGKSLEMVRQIVQPMQEAYPDGDLYTGFYRYANDLLFENNGYRIHSDWHICPECEQMLASWTEDFNGQKCDEAMPTPKQCNGTLRKITWDDLKPLSQREK